MAAVWRVLAAANGWIVVYFAGSNIFGYALALTKFRIGGCGAKFGMGGFDLFCGSTTFDGIIGFFAYVLGELLVFLPGIGLAMLRAAFKNGWPDGLSYLGESMIYFAYSVPVFLMLTFAGRYWWARSKLFVLTMGTPLVALILYSGLG